MSNVEKPSTTEVEAQHTSEPVYDTPEKAEYSRTGAIDAERIEHDMTVLQAVKAYPAASWWAFVMSCTIVSFVTRARWKSHSPNAATDHGVLLRVLDGTIRRHGSIRQGLWCTEPRWKVDH